MRLTPSFRLLRSAMLWGAVALASGCSFLLVPHREVVRPDIDGRVVRDGVPVAGMPVSYQPRLRRTGCNASAPTVRTDADGHFRFPRRDRLSFVVVAGHPWHLWGLCLHSPDGNITGWGTHGDTALPRAATFSCDLAAPPTESGRGEGVCLRVPQADDPVILELAARSRVPVHELRTIVVDCDRNQRNMNLCAFRDLVEAEHRLARHAAHLSERLSTDERLTLEADQVAWSVAAKARCNAEADDEAEGGSMRPMVFSHCLAKATEERVDALDAFAHPARWPRR